MSCGPTLNLDTLERLVACMLPDAPDTVTVVDNGDGTGTVSVGGVSEDFVIASDATLAGNVNDSYASNATFVADLAQLLASAPAAAAIIASIANGTHQPVFANDGSTVLFNAA